MFDPVLVTIILLLFSVALAFTYFVGQGDFQNLYNKLTKNSIVGKKLSEVKEKPQKQKRDKKPTEKQRTPSPISKAQQNKSIDKKLVTQYEIIAKESHQMPQHLINIEEKHEAEFLKALVTQFPQGKPIMQGNEQTDTSEMQANSSKTPIDVFNTEPTSTGNVQVFQQSIEKTASRKPVSKRKKKTAVASWDLDEQKFINYLLGVSGIQPESITFLAQHFADSNEKMTSLATTVSSLEKTISDLRQRAEQHCVARINAEKESQTNQHLVAEMSKKIGALEKELTTSKAVIEDFKKTSTDLTSLSATNAELQLRIDRLVQNEQLAQQRYNVMHQEIREWEIRSKAATQQIHCLHLALDANRQTQAKCEELQAELVAKEAMLSIVRSDFAEIELLAQDLTHEKRNLQKTVSVGWPEAAEKCVNVFGEPYIQSRESMPMGKYPNNVNSNDGTYFEDNLKSLTPNFNRINVLSERMEQIAGLEMKFGRKDMNIW